jgi:hypothetical protein
MRLHLAPALLLLASRLSAQSPDTTAYVTMQGADTVAIEQYVRTGQTITGAWIQHQGGLFVHDYALVLRRDDWPEHYVMTLYTTRPHTFLLSVTYGADSATRIMVRDSVARTERVVAPHAYPVGALSILGMDLALARASRAHVDSTTITLDRAEVRGAPQPTPVRFAQGDTVRIGPATWARVDRNGRLLVVNDGPRETRRVPPFDAARLTAGFRAADSVARASRIAITLSREALQRFVGEYALNPNVSLTVTLDGDKLTLRAGLQPAVPLVPQAPTTFFVEAALGLSILFETDAGGNVLALTLVQGNARQRAAKTK